MENSFFGTNVDTKVEYSCNFENFFLTEIATAARFFLPMILQNGNSHDMDHSDDVTGTSQYGKFDRLYMIQYFKI